MARKEIVTCDVCGTEKHDVNHWWAAELVPSASKLNTKGPGIAYIRFWEWKPQSEKYCQDADICGQECLNKWIDQNLNKLPIKESEKEK